MYINRPYKCRQNVIQYLCIWQGRKGGGGYSLLARVRSENEGSEQNQLKFDKSH